MRFKLGGDGPDIYRCCFCCHVKVGTIFLGIFVLFSIMMMLSMFAVMVLHPELLEHNNHLFQSGNSGILATVGNENYTLEAERWLTTHAQTGEDKFLGLLFLLGAFAITVMLLYGTMKGQAGYLMPFFCLQVFVFCLSCLTVVGYFSYFPNFKKWISEQKDWMPFKDELKQMDQDWLMLLVVLWFVLVLTVQAYLVGVVWACYKYINSSQLPNSNTTATGRTLVRDYVLEHNGTDDTEMLLPPKYEDVVRMNDEANRNQPPPPPYAEE